MPIGSCTRTRFLGGDDIGETFAAPDMNFAVGLELDSRQRMKEFRKEVWGWAFKQRDLRVGDDALHAWSRRLTWVCCNGEAEVRDRMGG